MNEETTLNVYDRGYRLLQLPASVEVKKKGETVCLNLKQEDDCRFERQNHTLRLVDGVSQRTIGKAEFFFKEESCLFLRFLRNCTIANGERQFSGVGTVLLGKLKEIAARLQIRKVKLLAQDLLSVPAPNSNNIIQFYEKNGFQIEERWFSGYLMSCSIACVQPAESARRALAEEGKGHRTR